MYPTYTAGTTQGSEACERAGGLPSTIGNDYVVYVDDFLLIHLLLNTEMEKRGIMLKDYKFQIQQY